MSRDGKKKGIKISINFIKLKYSPLQSGVEHLDLMLISSVNSFENVCEESISETTDVSREDKKGIKSAINFMKLKYSLGS